MRVSAVSYGRTISKDYQSWRAEVEVELGPGDSVEEASELAKLLVAEQLGEPPTAAERLKERELRKERIAELQAPKAKRAR